MIAPYMPDLEEGPYSVLGLPEGASDTDIRDAYLRKVKEFPPDRDPQGFERVRDAYEYLRDPKTRARRMLQEGNPMVPLTSLLGTSKIDRSFVGPDSWLAVIQERKSG